MQNVFSTFEWIIFARNVGIFIYLYRPFVVVGAGVLILLSIAVYQMTRLSPKPRSILVFLLAGMLVCVWLAYIFSTPYAPSRLPRQESIPISADAKQA